jgi:hypothetical protein
VENQNFVTAMCKKFPFSEKLGAATNVGVATLLYDEQGRAMGEAPLS